MNNDLDYRKIHTLQSLRHFNLMHTCSEKFVSFTMAPLGFSTDRFQNVSLLTQNLLNKSRVVVRTSVMGATAPYDLEKRKQNSIHQFENVVANYVSTYVQKRIIFSKLMCTFHGSHYNGTPESVLTNHFNLPCLKTCIKFNLRVWKLKIGPRSFRCTVHFQLLKL